MAKQKYYTVWRGRSPGVYATWSECEKQVKGFQGARFKSFPSKDSAEKAFREGPPKDPFTTPKERAKAATSTTTATSSYIEDSISVDAACSGNPGVMEYQGVETKTGKQIFHVGPIEQGTNNIGEFLAIVHALALLHKKNDAQTVIYSDSKIAISWVKKKKCNTTLKETEVTRPLLQLIRRAEKWLETHAYQNPILKWETKAWGEVKADFGRKS
ncbi:ribonuclease H [Bacillaceae bacterium SIJ1]|uniref:ribonuclease H1 domain-containing protein n=1 Tax=Litoribacterium kuwaitense TaxID=1398745 RepID=UPI0013EA4D78|nr:ribonuclease H family protein [Litoribacterium kuwaitense]NGP45388.1 ribonuclease H [Litoribacterium kuwaitense]